MYGICNKEYTAPVNQSYIGKRDDILSLIPAEVHRVLDIGCGIGTLCKQLKIANNTEVTGIESNEEMAEIAKKTLDRLVIADIEETDLTDYFSSEYFDCVILADILEHLINPWTILRNINGILNKDGLVIASIPNVRHYTTIINLIIKGYWSYRERGIHDKNHLRFFTLKNIEEMFANSGLKINKIKRNYRIIGRPHFYNKWSKYFAFSIFREYLAFQHIIVANK